MNRAALRHLIAGAIGDRRLGTHVRIQCRGALNGARAVLRRALKGIPGASLGPDLRITVDPP